LAYLEKKVRQGKRMEKDERILKLLEEIRDDQRVLIDEYRKVTDRALGLQTQAVDRQESLGKLYKGVVAVGSVIVVAIIVVIVWLLYVLLGYL
jgi:CHASE3 domain sensor protein